MTSRCIRTATGDDAAAIAAVYRPIVEETAISFELEPPSAADFRDRISETTGAGNPWLVSEVDGTVAGYAYASRFRSRPAYGATRETTIYVDPAHHGRGVGWELMNHLLDTLRDDEIHVAIAGITLPNEASVGLHERLGFEPGGVLPEVGYKFGRWHDLGFWHLRL